MGRFWGGAQASCTPRSRSPTSAPSRATVRLQSRRFHPVRSLRCSRRACSLRASRLTWMRCVRGPRVRAPVRVPVRHPWHVVIVFACAHLCGAAWGDVRRGGGAPRVVACGVTVCGAVQEGKEKRCSVPYTLLTPHVCDTPAEGPAVANFQSVPDAAVTVQPTVPSPAPPPPQPSADMEDEPVQAGAPVAPPQPVSVPSAEAAPAEAAAGAATRPSGRAPSAPASHSLIQRSLTVWWGYRTMQTYWCAAATRRT